MTDEQIIKNLELESMPSEMNCIYSRHIEACGSYCDKKKCYAENCAECTEHRMGYGGNRAKEILALIKRQQEEIKMLKTKDKIWVAIGQGLYDENKKLKAELERIRDEESEEDYK